jgi:hypothetical protein
MPLEFTLSATGFRDIAHLCLLRCEFIEDRPPGALIQIRCVTLAMVLFFDARFAKQPKQFSPLWKAGGDQICRRAGSHGARTIMRQLPPGSSQAALLRVETRRWP